MEERRASSREEDLKGREDRQRTTLKKVEVREAKVSEREKRMERIENETSEDTRHQLQQKLRDEVEQVTQDIDHIKYYQV